MPEAFERCRRAGGRIRTEQVDATHYRHVCYLGKKRYPGYVKKRKTMSDMVKKHGKATE